MIINVDHEKYLQKNFKVKYSKHKTVNIDYLMKYTTSNSSLGERMFRLKKSTIYFVLVFSFTLMLS